MDKKNTADKAKNAARKVAKKAAKKAAPETASATEVKLACVVTQDDTRIGAMWCKKGVTARLPEAKAKALEKMGKARIVGVA